MTNPRDEAHAALRRAAEAQRDAYTKMVDIDEGIGGLALRHPEMRDSMHAWGEGTENDHADTVLSLLDQIEAREAEAVRLFETLSAIRYRVTGAYAGDERDAARAVADVRRLAEGAALLDETEPTPNEREALARQFHEAYERLAPSFGYDTRKASAVPWEDVPEPNKSLMIAVAGEVIDGFHRQGPITDAMVEAALAAWLYNDGATDHDDMRAALEAAEGER